MTTTFDQLINIDVSEKLETKKVGGVTLSYLSWAYAWAQFKKICPEACYEIKKFKTKDNELLPYMYDEKTGYMVNTEVSDGVMLHEMWLPVLDANNKAMKSEPYQYKTSKGETKTVNTATMFDINTAIMRCLVKNIAMFGLGLNIYAGEDLPGDMTIPDEEEKKQKQTDLLTAINSTKSYTELELLYKNNKKEIIANSTLLDLIKERGKTLRSAA